jgi:imidazolonepropionase-like amidohydrolase
VRDGTAEARPDFIGQEFSVSQVSLLAVIFGSAILAGTATFAGGQAVDAGVQLALVGGTVHADPEGEPIRDGVVLVQGGRIVAAGSRASVKVQPNVQAIDCSGMTVLAGFWNSHVHFAERKWTNAAAIPATELAAQLQDMVTRYGFTSVFDIGSMSENTRRIRDRIEASEVPGPRIRSTGEVLHAPGAIPADAVLRALGYMTYPAHAIIDAAQATEAARKLLAAGADGIKVHLQPPPQPGIPVPESAIAATVDEAHRAGKPVFVHPAHGAHLLAAVRAGVDVIAHTTPGSGPWDEATLAAMKKGKVALTPTLTVWKHLLRHDRNSVREPLIATSIGQLRAWRATEGTVLFGNDLGAVEYDPTEEYVLMAEAGMSFRQILASLTTAPAERFGAATQLGRIAPGLAADLTVLKGDPSADIRALAAVQFTLRDGKIIYRAPR